MVQAAYGLEAGAGGAPSPDPSLGRIAIELGSLGVSIADVAGHVEDVTAEIGGQVRDFAELQAAARLMGKRNLTVTEAARSASQAAASARATATENAEAVQQVIADVVALADGVSEIGDQITGLEEALRKVSGVAAEIGSIARQTQLLAINAGIEAARAGEAGRGFSVLAGAVRDLAGKTAEATREINGTLEVLTTRTRDLLEAAETSVAGAGTVRAGTTAIGAAMDAMTQAVVTIDGRQNSIAAATADIADSISTVEGRVDRMSAGLRAASGSLGRARDRLNGLLCMGERLIGETAALGIETVDTPYIEAVQDAAARVAAAFEHALATGWIGREALFDTVYRPIPGSDPPQVLTGVTDLTDRLLPPIQEPLLGLSPEVVFCAAVDRNGYLPTHNRKFSHPQRREDPAWNAANSRNRRIFDDRVGLAAGRNTRPFLMQAYRRDMGNGSFAMMKDVSAPIFVGGRHWGGLRLAYRA